MCKKINKLGEEGYNNFGSKVIIVEYRGCMDIDVYFPEYNWTFKHTRYGDFKKGEIKCPYEPRYFGKLSTQLSNSLAAISTNCCFVNISFSSSVKTLLITNSLNLSSATQQKGMYFIP